MMKKNGKVIIILAILLAVALGISAWLVIKRNQTPTNLQISFISNPTTGYQWSYAVSDNSIINITQDYQSQCPVGVTGCGGEEIFTITALQPGETTLTFNYARSWESVQPIYTAQYQLKIDSELRISEKHSGSYFERASEKMN